MGRRSSGTPVECTFYENRLLPTEMSRDILKTVKAEESDAITSGGRRKEVAGFRWWKKGGCGFVAIER